MITCFKRLGPLCAIFAGALALAACGNSTADPNTPGDDSDGGNNPPPSSGACTEVLEFVFPPQRYGESDLIRQVVVDGTDIYFRSLSDVYRVPAAGGTPVSIADFKGHQPTHFWVRNGQVIVLAYDELYTVPTTGGTLTRLGDKLPAAPRSPLLADSPDLVLDATQAIWLSITKVNPSHAAIFSRPIAGGDAKILYEVDGSLSNLQRVGDTLFFSKEGTEGVQKLPVAGGTPAPADIPKMKIFGADSEALYANNESFTDPALLKIKPGSAPETIFKRSFSSVKFVSSKSGPFFGGITALSEDKSSADSFGFGVFKSDGAAGKRVACVPSGYTTHALGANDTTLFMAVYKTADNVASIAYRKISP